MKIHTSGKIDMTVLYAVLAQTTDGVRFERCDKAGSRSHRHGFEVTLSSDGTPDRDGTPRNRPVNAGTSRYLDRFTLPKAASYADWGRFLAALFEIDPDAKCPYYAGREDFHAKTAGAFLSLATA